MPSSNEQKRMNEKSHSFHQRKYSQTDLHENRGDKSSAKVKLNFYNYDLHVLKLILFNFCSGFS